MSDASATELMRIKEMIKQGHFDDALQAVIAVQQGLEGIQGATAFLLRGMALAGMSQPERAERSYRTAYSIVRYAPESELVAQRILGEAAEYIGQKDEAIAAHRAVLAAVPDDAVAQAGLARLTKV